MDTLIEKPWNYVLKTDGKQYVLEVVCGTIGMYIEKYHLTVDDISAYKTKGDRYIESIVRNIQNKK